jgi:hypothetical protein
VSIHFENPVIKRDLEMPVEHVTRFFFFFLDGIVSKFPQGRKRPKI